jgi:outer membrane protein OmpA-like peptidoglycan-associated protein
MRSGMRSSLRTTAGVVLAVVAMLAGCQRETEAQKAEKVNRAAEIALADVNAATPLPDAVKTFNQVVVRFAPGSTEIPAETQAALKAVARAIDRLPPTARLHVTGHTDPSEEAGLGLTLGLKRSSAVVDFLYANGAPMSKVSPIGVGNQKAAKDQAGEEAQARNRRVEFRIAN